MPIKGSKDSDYSLASNKSLSQQILSCGWHPGLGNLDQNDLKPIPLMSPTKKKTKYKTLQLFLMQTSRLAASFEGLYISPV